MKGSVFTMSLKLEDKVKLNEKVRDFIRNEGECVSDALPILEALDFTGTVTKITDESVYVGFVKGESWVTMVFDENEVEVVK